MDSEIELLNEICYNKLPESYIKFIEENHGSSLSNRVGFTLQLNYEVNHELLGKRSGRLVIDKVPELNEILRVANRCKNDKFRVIADTNENLRKFVDNVCILNNSDNCIMFNRNDCTISIWHKDDYTEDILIANSWDELISKMKIVSYNIMDDGFYKLNSMCDNKLPESYIKFIRSYGGKFLGDELGYNLYQNYKDNYEPYGIKNMVFPMDYVPTIDSILSRAEILKSDEYWELDDPDYLNDNERNRIREFMNKYTCILDGDERVLMFNKEDGSLRTFWTDGENPLVNKPTIIAKSWDSFMGNMIKFEPNKYYK